MDTRRTPASGGRRTLSDLHLLLLSVAAGFCISFGGSLIFAERISTSALATSGRSELVNERTADRTVTVGLRPAATTGCMRQAAVSRNRGMDGYSW